MVELPPPSVRRKPQGFRRVNRSHPMANGLTAFVYHTGANRFFDSVSGTPLTVTAGTPTLRPGPEGLAWGGVSGVTANLPLPTFDRANTSLIVRGATKAIPTSSASVMAVYGSLQFTGLAIGLSATVGATCFGTGNSGGFNNQAASYGGVFADEFHTYGAVFSGISSSAFAQGYLDGRYVGITASATNASGFSNHGLVLGFSNSASFEYSYIACFNRRLSAAEMAWWHDHAFEVLEPDLVFAKAPAGGPVPQAVAAAASGALVIGKTVQKSIALGIGAQAALNRGVGKLMPMALAAALLIARARGVLQVLAIALAGAVDQQRATAKTILAGLAGTAAVGRASTILQGVAVALSGALSVRRANAKALAAVLAGGLQVGRAATFLRVVAIGLLGAIEQRRATATTILAGMTAATAIAASRAYLQFVAMGLAGSLAQRRQAGKLVPAGLAASSILRRDTGKPVAIAAQAGVTTARGVAKALSLAGALSVAVQASRAFLRAIGIGLGAGLSIGRAVGKAVSTDLAAALSVAGAAQYVRQVVLALAGSAGVARAAGKRVAVPADLSLALAKAVSARIGSALGAGVLMIRGVGKRLTMDALAQALVNAGLGTGEVFAVLVQASLGASLELRRGVAKTLRLAAGLLAWLFPPYRRPPPDPRRSPFSLAMADLLDDPNLGRAATYVPALGDPLNLRVVLGQADRERMAGRTGQILRFLEVSVARRDVAGLNQGVGPAEGDVLTIDEQAYVVRSWAGDALRTSVVLRLELVSS